MDLFRRRRVSSILLLMIVLVSQAACSQEKIVNSLITSFTLVSTAAAVQVGVVTTLQQDGTISTEEAAAFMKLTQGLPVAASKAIDALSSTDSFASKINAVASIFLDANSGYFLDSKNPKLHAAYVAVKTTLDSLAVALKGAAAKANVQVAAGLTDDAHLNQSQLERIAAAGSRFRETDQRIAAWLDDHAAAAGD